MSCSESSIRYAVAFKPPNPQPTTFAMKQNLRILAALLLLCSNSLSAEPPVGKWSAIYYPLGFMATFGSAELLTIHISENGTYAAKRVPFYTSHTKGFDDRVVNKSSPIGLEGRWMRSADMINFTWEDGKWSAKLKDDGTMFTAVLSRLPTAFHNQAALTTEADSYRKLIVGEWETVVEGHRLIHLFGSDGTLKIIRDNSVEEKKYYIDADQHPISLVTTHPTSIYPEGGRPSIPTEHLERQFIQFVSNDFLSLMEPVSGKPFLPEHSRDQIILRRAKR